MKFSRNKILCQSTARIIILHLILVSVRVKSVCIEEDCTDHSIKVVDLTSGQCITCFPCPECVAGQTPSVPCGSTVPPGTDIHCVRRTPDPVVISKASAHTTVLILLATSPSVTSWRSSLTETAIKSRTNPVVVSATSSKNYNGGSSSSAVNTHFEHRGKTAKDHKMGERTVLFLSLGVTLPVICFIVSLAILCRLRKRKTVQSQVRDSSRMTPMSHDPRSGTFHVSNSDTFAVRVHPETNSAVTFHARNSDTHFAVRVHPETNSAEFSRSYPEDDEQATQQGNNNEHFQHHQGSFEANVVAIPSSLDAEGNHPREINQDLTSDDKSLDPPVQPKKTNKDPKPLINAGSKRPREINQNLTSDNISLIDFSLDPPDQPKKTNKDTKTLINADREEMPKELRPITLASKDQSTSITGLYDSTNVLNPCPVASTVPQEFQNILLSGKMADIPIDFYRKICNKLDKLRECFWDDFRMLGEAIGLGKDEVLLLAQIGSPTDKMIQKFDSQRDSSIEKFRDIVKKMGRDDVVCVINEWLVYEYKSCPDMLV